MTKPRKSLQQNHTTKYNEYHASGVNGRNVYQTKSERHFRLRKEGNLISL